MGRLNIQSFGGLFRKEKRGSRRKEATRITEKRGRKGVQLETVIMLWTSQKRMRGMSENRRERVAASKRKRGKGERKCLF